MCLSPRAPAVSSTVARGHQYQNGRSERKVVELGVVEVPAAPAPAAGRAGRRTTSGAAARSRGRRSGELALALLARSLLEVDDAVGRDLERSPLLAVPALELAGLEATLDEDLVALAEGLGGALGTIAPDADPEPVGRLDPLAGLLVLRALVHRDVELGDRSTVRRVAHLGVSAQVADDHRLAECHLSASINRGRSRLGLGLVDPFRGVEVVFVLVGGRQVRTLDAVLILSLRTGSGGADRPLDAGNEVADDLLRDQQEALHLDDGLGR